MKDKPAIELLIGELENDYSYIRESARLREKALVRLQASGWTDDLDLMVLGACLHSLYNALEAYFLRVAKFFENSVDQLTWHRDLLDRMTLEIRDTRPALVTDPVLAARIDELRRFRHLFRNLYKSKLHPGKLKIVDEAAAGIDEAFLPMYRTFIAWLENLSMRMGESSE